MSILVATKLTSEDHAARELAAVLAKRLGEGLVLAHVVECGDLDVPVVRAELDKAVAEVGRFGIATEPVLLNAGGSHALMSYARQMRPHLVVIGTAHATHPHASGFAKARALLSRIDVPVLYGSNVAPLMSALMGCRRPRILAALGDGETTDTAVTKMVEELRRTIPSDCTFFASGLEASNDALRTRAASGSYDLVVAGAKAHLPMLDGAATGELCPILFVTPKRHVVCCRGHAQIHTSEPAA